MSDKRLFEIGYLTTTPRAFDAIQKTGASMFVYLGRHHTGDWGDSSAIQAEANDKALVDGGMLTSSYSLPDLTLIWITTATDRSNTTIWLADEFWGYSSSQNAKR